MQPISIATEAISNIKKHFEVSLLAEQKTSETAPIVRYSEYTRNHVLTVLGRQALKARDVLEQLKMIKSPDVQNLNEKVGAVNFDWRPNKTLFFDAVGRFYFKRVLTCFLNLENDTSLAWHAVTSETAALLNCSYYQPSGSHCSQGRPSTRNCLRAL